ncbi:hypothetical protein ACHQM5_029592 [Ranunculus cassubicifolius]
MKPSKKIQRSLPPSVPGSAPWLVYPCGIDRKKQTFFNISNPKITYVTNFHEIREKECLLSMHGWLLIRNMITQSQCQGKRSSPKVDNGGDRYFLWDPVTRQTICLPSRNLEGVEALGFFNLTSAPTCSDCMVLFVGRSYILSFIVGGDSWTKHQYTLEEDADARDDFIDNVVTSNGTLYAVTNKHRLAIIERAACGALSVRLLDFDNPQLCPKTQSYPESIPPVFDPIASTTRCPWLMYFNNEVSTCNFLDPMTSITHTFEIPELLGSRICFSNFGWLLMSQGDRSMFFFNPFDMATIDLPDLPRDFAFNGLSFSCSPTSSDCIIFGAHSLATDKVDICYLRLGEDDWTSVQFKNSTRIFLCDANPVFLNGRFYCLSYEQHLGIFDMEYGMCNWTVLCTTQPCKSGDQNYLVQYDGKLLSIFVGPKGKWVNIHEFDILQNKWWHVTELSDKMLFVSRRTSIAMKAVSEGMQNKIYLPVSSDGLENNVYYCLQTKRWHSSLANYHRSDIYFTRELLHCTWVQPTLSPENGLL